MPRPSPPRLLPILLALTLAGCTPMPDFAAFPETAASAAPPSLMPIDQLLAQAGSAPRAEAAAQSLSARAARLRARAALMRGPVNDPVTRARLLAAIHRGDA
ncbi:hypothetical protein MASR1M32_16620 [Rhodobacter sp.]